MCSGVPPALLEARLVLPQLFEGFPDPRTAVADGERKRVAPTLLNHLKELPALSRP